jgi:hypothetical protein
MTISEMTGIGNKKLKVLELLQKDDLAVFNEGQCIINMGQFLTHNAFRGTQNALRMSLIWSSFCWFPITIDFIKMC